MNDRFIEEFHPESNDVAICGSILIVATPELSETRDWPTFSDDEIIKTKGWLIRRQIANIAKAKAVLIANYYKNGVDNYIGSNTFLELGVGFIYAKPLYLLNEVPKQDNREEILALEPIVLNGDIERFIEEVKAL